MLGSLDPAKILVILVIALVVLGPERLPRAARQLGAAWRELTRVRDQVSEEVRSAMPDLDLPQIPRLRHGAVSGFLTDLSRPTPQREATADAEATAIGVGDGPEGSGDAVLDAVPARRRPANLVVHPGLSDFSFPPDDPGMN